MSTPISQLQVLHMIDNPCSRALSTSTTARNAALSTVPRDQIKSMKHQILELQQRVNEYEASASPSNEPNNQSMDMSALPQRGAYAIHGTTQTGTTTPSPLSPLLHPLLSSILHPPPSSPLLPFLPIFPLSSTPHPPTASPVRSINHHPFTQHNPHQPYPPFNPNQTLT